VTQGCAVPGCFDPAADEDCCTGHSAPDRGNHPAFAPNDGIVDQVAIELAVQGAREVRLTWVEFEIAAATAIVRGLSLREASRRLGIQIRSGGTSRRRWDSIARIEYALRKGEQACFSQSSPAP
jgi:hypothetical protein